jgi:hypothetical protein
MNKREYFILIVLMFGLITLLNFMNLVSPGILRIPYWSLVKTFFTIFICVAEINYIKNDLPKAIGFGFCVVFLVGTLFKIMHWPGANIMILAASVVLIIDLTVMALIEKNKGLLQYLLFAFIGLRMSIFINLFYTQYEIIWWLDAGICCLIAVVGILTLKADIK